MNRIKKLVNSYPFLRKVLLPVYIFIVGAIYQVYKVLHLHFSYRLADHNTVRFLPKGQIAFALFMNGFEKRELALYQVLIKQGDVIIDAGANIGLYSILGSRIVGEKGKVYSFEPSGANFDILKKNIQLNKCNNIVPVNMGLGDKTGEILELFQEEGSGDAEKYVFRSSINETAVSAPDSKVMHVSEKISLETLDNFRSKMNLSKIDFLKIDVEGFEYFLLKGAENALKENPGMIILFECASHLAERAGVTKAEVLQFLEGLGFEIFYWNAIDKTWSDDAAGVWASGQLLAGRNLMDRIRSIKV